MTTARGLRRRLTVIGVAAAALIAGLTAGCDGTSNVERGVDAAKEAQELGEEVEARQRALEEARKAAP